MRLPRDRIPRILDIFLFGYFIIGIRSKTYVGDRHGIQPLVGGCV